MEYRVNVPRFRAGRTALERGDRIDATVLEQVFGARVDSFRRLGIVEPVQEDVDLKSLTKADLQTLADERGLEVPSGALKSDIVDILKENQ